MKRTTPSKPRAGFSLIEMTLAMAIGLVLFSATVKAMAPVRESSAMRSSDQVMRVLMSRARAEAIERGATVLMRVDPVGDSAWLEAAGQQIDRFDFHSELAVDVFAQTDVTVCMTPRGVSDSNCNQPSLPVVGFKAGGAATYIKILPSGQLIRS